MTKLKLDWDALVVESFPTAEEGYGPTGTVEGREALSGPLCGTLATRLTCCPCTPRADDL